MKVRLLLHTLLKKELPAVHMKRFSSLLDAVETLLGGATLKMSELGRTFVNAATTRSNIKKMDRLLGNRALHEEIPLFYQVLSGQLVQEDTQPIIAVDWSCLSAQNERYLLRASRLMEGRSIVVYEEVHPKVHENNHEIHKQFLKHLKRILPKGVQPVIVTDAGFRAPWFAYVRELGWDFVGRLRNKNAVKLTEDEHWQKSCDLWKGANETPQYLGEGWLTEKLKLSCHFILYKGKKKNRRRKNQNGSTCQASKSRRYAKAFKEPWLLVTSLPASSNLAKKTVKLYQGRMQIEENFRDTKSHRFGFGSSMSGSKGIGQLRVLLLIAALATFVCWIAGRHVQQHGRPADYQAQSSKFTSILSIVNLGRQTIKRGWRITKEHLDDVLLWIQKFATPLALEPIHDQF